MARRHELSDEQWNAIKGLVPGKKGDPGRTGCNNRLFINAVLFVLKTGIPWEDLPGRYGKPNSVWKRYDRWCASGVWERIFLAIGESELTDELQEVQIDSTSIKAHPVASTGRRLADEKKKTLTNDAAWAVLVED
jgi:putative transposase